MPLPPVTGQPFWDPGDLRQASGQSGSAPGVGAFGGRGGSVGVGLNTALSYAQLGAIQALTAPPQQKQDTTSLSLLPDVGKDEGPAFAWDVVYLNDRRIPGLSEVTFRRLHRGDIRTINGADYGSISLLGYSPSEINIRTRLWTAQQLNDFQTLIPFFQPIPGKPPPSAASPGDSRPQSNQIRHPALAMWGIREVVILEIAGPQKTATPQVFEVLLRAVESTFFKATGVYTAAPASDITQQISQSPGTKQPTPSQSANATSTTLGSGL